jgi:CRP-like cAMP-binding protein
MESNTARLIRKLSNYQVLAHDEQRALEHACGEAHRFATRDDLVKEGDRPPGVNLIVEGFACRYKLLPDGRRQIIGYLIPGDMCDVRICILRKMDHAISALTPGRAALFTRDSMLELTDFHPRLARALWWSTLVDESITREWVVNVGHRTAFERLAHLFCEMFVRLRAAGLADENVCELPLTQTELADALALSAVHVNRVLMELRQTGLVTFRSRRLTIHDHEALRSLAGFTPDYLHLDNGEAALSEPGLLPAEVPILPVSHHLQRRDA